LDAVLKTHVDGNNAPNNMARTTGLRRTRALVLMIALIAASCSSVNLKAVEDPTSTQPPSSTTQPEKVLGTSVTAAPTTTEVALVEKGLAAEVNEAAAGPSATVAVVVPASSPVAAGETSESTRTTASTSTSEVLAEAEEEVPSIALSIETEVEEEPAPRIVVHNNFDAFGTVGGFTLYLPAREVELVGFHESNHDGAQQVEQLSIANPPMVTMETRDRGNGSRTAIDVAVNRASEIRSPVTGTVVRSGTYTLYCQYSDDYAVIAPDEQPTWEVKLLHINGVQVKAGDRVIAQETVIAPAPTPLPFRSQIDKLTVAPPPPHVHIEVVDPSIPDRPSGGC
jgi:hypothetical protein